MLKRCLYQAVVDAGSDPDAEVVNLDPIVVIGSRAREPLQQVVASVSVIDRDQLERNGVVDIADLSRLVPGVSVPVDAVRFGRQGFNIRGLEGNRVGVEIISVPMPMVSESASSPWPDVIWFRWMPCSGLKFCVDRLQPSMAAGRWPRWLRCRHGRPRIFSGVAMRAWPVVVRQACGVVTTANSARPTSRRQMGPGAGWFCLRAMSYESENNPRDGGISAKPADFDPGCCAGQAGLRRRTRRGAGCYPGSRFGQPAKPMCSRWFWSNRYSTTYALQEMTGVVTGSTSLPVSQETWAAADVLDMLVCNGSQHYAVDRPVPPTADAQTPIRPCVPASSISTRPVAASNWWRNHATSGEAAITGRCMHLT
ncbi:MAG: TonB-dependent receptor plug domain-containing protein [Dokdonella sp.]